MKTVPAVGRSNPATSDIKVLLPQPLGPTMATNCPGWIFSVVSANASIEPRDDRKTVH